MANNGEFTAETKLTHLKRIWEDPIFKEFYADIVADNLAQIKVLDNPDKAMAVVNFIAGSNYVFDSLQGQIQSLEHSLTSAGMKLSNKKYGFRGSAHEGQ